jgi:hypothetical protein
VKVVYRCDGHQHPCGEVVYGGLWALCLAWVECGDLAPAPA